MPVSSVSASASASASASSSQWTWNYIRGLIFIVLVALIWAASSVLVQSLYTDFEFNSPFLLTYIGSSLFTLWLPTKAASLWLDKQPWFQSISLQRMTNTNNININNNNVNRRYDVAPSDEPLDNDDVDLDENGSDWVPNLLQAPLNTATAASAAAAAAGASTGDWTHKQHFQVALCIAPVWFLANWTYNASLQDTSITSSTVLASTGSVFTFFFAVLARDEQFGCLKLMGVLLGVTGSILTALSDAPSSTTTTTTTTGDERTLLDSALSAALYHPPDRFLSGGEDGNSNLPAAAALWGDFLGLVSAVGYGGYAVQTRLLCPHDESRYSMQLLLGYIGLANMVVLMPVTLYLLLQQKIRIPWTVVGALIGKGLLDNVLSDYLWLRAVILTNATVATVGLGMTIPLAFLSDVWLGKTGVFTFLSTAGALAVLAGFVLVNLGNRNNDNNNNNNEVNQDHHHHFSLEEQLTQLDRMGPSFSNDRDHDGQMNPLGNQD